MAAPGRVLRRFARDHVTGLAAVLSAISLGLVFAAVLRAAPAATLPRAPEGVVAAIPHVNAVISVVAVAVIGQGWRWGRRGEVRRHRAAMVVGFVLFAAFLGLYLYRVALEGPTTFPGEGGVRMAYLGVLAVHVTLAVVCIPLLYYVLLLGATRPVEEIRRTRHARVGRVAATLWLTSFVLGLVVYALLYLVY